MAPQTQVPRLQRVERRDALAASAEGRRAVEKLIPLPLYGRIQRATIGCGHTIVAHDGTSIWQACPHCGHKGLVIRWETIRD